VTARRAGGSRVRTVFLGSGRFGVGPLRRLAEHPRVDLVGVVTAPPRPAGRRHQPTPTAIDIAARELSGAAILAPVRLRAPDAVAAVLALDPELAVLADFGQLVPAALLDLRHGALNLHPSLLPRHRGATPIPAAILAGDAESGVTLMRMDEGLDTGPIVAQRRVALSGTETAPELESALATVATDLLADDIEPWLRGEIAARPQADEEATMTRPLRREDGRLDPARPAVELERQVRAYQPWPGSFVDTEHGRVTVWQASLQATSDRPPGIFGPRGLSTADGELLLHEVQPAGGRPMPWDAFVRGRPGIVGSEVRSGPRPAAVASSDDP
jgi:methionyl-tRNA formyltransferase